MTAAPPPGPSAPKSGPAAGPASGSTSGPAAGPDPVPRPTAAPAPRPRDPLHGLTLEAIVTRLSAHYGWPGLGERLPIRCFTHDPSVASSLKFLRRTPWARAKVESLYLLMLREIRRGELPGG